VVSPAAVEMEDICKIFFAYSSPGSRLQELGRMRLATELNDAREGAAHLYEHKNDIIGDHHLRHMVKLLQYMLRSC
jgi:hypothetical protein